MREGILTVIEHPLAAMVALISIVAAIASTITWVGTTFVFKSDYNRDKDWHEYAHQNIRNERLNDEVDRLRIRQAASGKSFPPVDVAELALWEKKLGDANKKLDKAEERAKAASR